MDIFGGLRDEQDTLEKLVTKNIIGLPSFLQLALQPSNADKGISIDVDYCKELQAVARV